MSIDAEICEIERIQIQKEREFLQRMQRYEEQLNILKEGMSNNIKKELKNSNEELDTDRREEYTIQMKIATTEANGNNFWLDSEQCHEGSIEYVSEMDGSNKMIWSVQENIKQMKKVMGEPNEVYVCVSVFDENIVRNCQNYNESSRSTALYKMETNDHRYWNGIWKPLIVVQVQARQVYFYVFHIRESAKLYGRKVKMKNKIQCFGRVGGCCCELCTSLLI